MYFKGLVIAMSLLTTAAFPFHPTGHWEDAAARPQENEANDKTALAKDVDNAYKSSVDRSDLYRIGDDEGRGKSPMEEELRHKLGAEVERLRARLRQELAELTERLAPRSAHAAPGPPGDLRRRLAQPTRRLQSSLRSDVRELCDQLGLSLQGLQREEAGPSAHREAFHEMSRALERSGARLASITGLFQSEASGAAGQRREGGGGEEEGQTWRETRAGLAREVSSAGLEAQSRLGALKAELATLLVTPQPPEAEVTAKVSEFCQRAALQNQLFLDRIDRVLLGLEEEQEAHGALPSPADPSPPGSLLHHDFSAKFSALMQDILHSVQ